MNVALLRRLRGAAGEYVPFAALGAAPGDAHRDLDELEAYGFAIERHPLYGVAYRGPAERLCPDQIEDGLGTTCVGRRLAVWNRVSSTNDLAARAAHSEANAGLVVLAEEQTAGRGRRGRSWTAPPRSSILMSALLFPPPALADPAWLTALAAVAVAEVVSEWTGAAAAIKWPNDVRVEGRKIAGILVECGDGAVVGIGVNGNVEPDDFPADLRGAATSLGTLVGGRVDRSEFVRDLIRRLDALYDGSLRGGVGVVGSAWRDRSEHLGRDVAVVTPTGPVSGRLDDLDLREGLRLTLADGSTLRLPAPHVLAISPREPGARGA